MRHQDHQPSRIPLSSDGQAPRQPRWRTFGERPPSRRSSEAFSTVPHLPCPAHTRSTPRQETRLWDSLLLIKPPTLMSGAFCFYGICRKKRGPTSGLEPFSCSSYEFACARSSPSWCVRKLRLSMGFSAPPPRLRVHCVVACTSPVAVNPLAKTLIADLIITSDNSCVAEVLPTAIRDPYAPIDWPS
jgi:hypothetical protein